MKQRRNLRQLWHRKKNKFFKKKLNSVTHELEQMLKKHRTESFESFTESLSPYEDTNYSLYRITKAISRPRLKTPPLLTSSGWARSPAQKAETLATFYESAFRPNSDAPPPPEVAEFLDSPLPMSLPIKPSSPNEIRSIIQTLPNNKAPGIDKIATRILKELPMKAVVFLTNVF